MGEARGKQRAFGVVMGLVLAVELMASGRWASGQSSSPPESGQQPGIEVQVYNYAQVPSQTLERSEEEAARVFHLIGVEIAWRNCNPATTDIHLDTDCAPDEGPLNLTARIVPRFAIVPGVAGRETMGLSFGDRANVSYGWVTDEADALKIAPSDILGPILAHELAHPLLHHPGHSKVGIMQPRLGREDFETAAQGTLTFTREQGEAIRIEIRERAQQQAARDAAISVQVYNYAQVTNEVVAKAESVAEGIFRAAGVEIAWTNCEPGQKDLGDATRCNQLSGPTTLFVRILPCFGVVPGTDNKTMGFALGTLASVSLRRVSEDTAEFGVKPYEVLGPAIAHELGHLLGQREHSPSGIMRARWRREDYERAPLGAFKFTAEQAEQMRTEVARRNKMQRAEALPGMAARK